MPELITNETPFMKPRAQVLGTRRSFRKGEALWEAGDDPTVVWAVQQGYATIEFENDKGGRAMVQVCRQGQSLCPAAAILGRPFPCRAVASADLVAVAVPAGTMQRALGLMAPEAASQVRQIAEEMCQSHIEHSQEALPARVRLAKLLERLHLQFRGLSLPFGRSALADMSGVSPETVSRTLHPWEQLGIISSGTNSVKVLLPAQLQALQD